MSKPSTTHLVLYTALVSALLALLVATAQGGTKPPDLSGYPWVYLRDGRLLGDDDHLAEVIFVGDIMLGRGTGEQPALFDSVAPWLRAADLAVGNFEGVITTQGVTTSESSTSQVSPFNLIARPSVTQVLEKAGFDILGLANNHTLDLGDTGLTETITHLQAAGLQIAGIEHGGSPNTSAVMRQVDDLRLAFLAYNTIPQSKEPGSSAPDRTNRWNEEEAIDAIQAAHQRADFVIVFMHWGYEYQAQTDPAQRQAANQMLEAGADLIIGHHPHTVQSTQIFRKSDLTPAIGDQFTAFSLGNFVSDQYFENARQGLALRVFFDQNGLRAIQALPIQTSPRPRLLTLEEASTLLAHVQPPPQELSFICTEDACSPTNTPADPSPGIFWSGEVDLTGDGLQEKVVRSKDGVKVFKDNAVVWSSPPEWQVLDLALGDPNDDGRGEILLALLKMDSDGVLRSHPFIIGYRAGIYRLLWGGSAVKDPILEVELGDMDGDGVQELIVLEEQGDAGQGVVTVWRWHGWGFSLSWRSEPGRYKNMRLTTGAAPVISVDKLWGEHP